MVQTWLGCIIAATVIAFPLMYRNARAAFELVDVNLIYAARTLGMGEVEIFWKVAVPAAGPGILSGTILTFARAMGEYGATSMLAGNIPGKTGTISQKIAMVIQDGDYLTAGYLGRYCDADRLRNRVPDESGIRKAHEADETMVA